ncbi:hypothetical protein BASA50_002175 [Batrachochytrium salamandrivorans]|uniref:Cilia- and flagella-associated protein 53 n=1 Tax=Batrachochytrium salamandrivorans TaxID=1357716 RepID=A0ABQ8FM34_9FUNG|nr:hypothetical protein BASA61_009903 [Batrachochytrium salamandrivorans]KAH6600610.1 hypothetical protein BASA50_002175 [Batrachochytrium salamandrivorans]KAH9250607.1 hypothetical protein BASA81_011590 [Batrachochytrium salamandrivorans]KAH9272223.1 hypothetical protein BASA83_005565 [Batrachochytrium salamandrivorans]
MTTAAARPLGLKPDYLITNRRREEDSRNLNRETTQYYARTAMKSQFEEKTNKSIRQKHILQRFNELKAAECCKLEERQNRLRQLFSDDEERYRQCFIAKEETRESRVDAMRARMMELRELREREHKAVVEDKLMQRWRNECDELRAVESKMREKQVAVARELQIQEQADRKALERKEEHYYDVMWEHDRQKKIDRENADRAHQKEINETMTLVLAEQMQALKIQAQTEVELKREEARLMREEYETRQIEDEREYRRKLQEQRIIRQDLDDFNKIKLKQRQHDVQEALEMDMKIISEFLTMEKEEKEGKQRRRDEWRQEMRLHREHLLTQREEEKNLKREIECWYMNEQERVWKGRTEKWRKEQAVRDKLMKDVIEGRHEQIQYALERNRQRQEQIYQEKLEIEKQIQEAKASEAQRYNKAIKTKYEWSTLLKDQIEAVERKRLEEKHRIQSEDDAAKLADSRYQMLLQSELARASHS